MSDPLEELIKEIAVKHGMAVSRDDPILVLHTINNRLMADCSKAQEELLEKFKEELESLALRWGSDATTKSEKILNAALLASKNTMAQSMQETAKLAASAFRSEVDSALAAVSGPMVDAQRVAQLNIAAACITLVAAAIAAWAALG